MTPQEFSQFSSDVKRQYPHLTFTACRSLSAMLRRLEKTPPEKQQEAEDAIKLELAVQAERCKARAENLPKLSYPEELPVSQRREEIVKAIREHQVVIIAGETGSGKTTQIPKMCLEAGLGVRGMIGHTQPRRLAARAVAARIAEELGENLGQSVGFKVRFTDVTSPEACIKLMTDGILLAETQTDRLLLNYDCIIIDEAHERSLNIDFLLGYLKQLLQKRRDLKLIITSATIDPQRFSRHFGNAPVIEVSGRTYPVEVIYQPLEEFSDAEDDEEDERQTVSLREGVLRSFKLLQHEHGRGDTLVFLPGERDIMDMAAFLNRSHLPGVEVVPLFARLATSEQNKIFAPHGGVRIVLATNIAETSLTVPGIRYVIDPGTARISRYSPRTKVQRLPVEKISQASANQRKGRCGRVSDGVCVRLYSEDDFNARPEFTDPEILRTNLAAVILQMISLHLGDISKFPFIDPPEPRQVSDGMRLLEEFGALEDARGHDTSEVKLTKTGTLLSRIPADPRLGRMLIEAQRYGAVSEVLIIVSGLAVMDPREYPPDRKEQSRQLHHRFDDEKSDFLSWINLYRYLSKKEAELSRSAFSRLLKKELLSYLRVREWFDVLRQLRATCRVLKFNLNSMEDAPAHYEAIHRSVVSGLLSQAGTLDSNEKGIYLGARGIKFVIHPSSVLAKKHPRWICASELSETSRLFARTVAEIRPEWLEWAGQHLIKKTYSEPHWSKKQGAVQASLTVTLYGLRLAEGRQALYTQVDPAMCREIFIRDALVGGDMDCNFEFFRRNLKMIEDVEHIEDKQRRRDLLVDDQVMIDFYAKRLPEDIVTQRHFEKWWREKSKTDPHYLDFSPELITRGAADSRKALYPEHWQAGSLRLPLSYVFEPSSPKDGVSVHIPLTVLGQVRAADFEWQIPGLRQELLASLIKSLPKRLRRNLIPAPDYASALSEAVGAQPEGRLWDRCAKELARMGGEQVAPEDFDRTLIPRHLFVNFIIEDASGKEIASGRDLDALRDQLSGKAREALQQAVKHKGPAKQETSWTFGTVKQQQVTRQGRLEITAYPALSDKGSAVVLELFDTPLRQREAMWKGERRLLFLTLKQPVSYLEAHLPNRAKLSMYYSPIGSVRDLISDIMLASVDSLMRRHGAPVWSEEEFRALSDRIRGELNDESLAISKKVEQILSRAHELTRLLKGQIMLNAAFSYQDIGKQLSALVYKGFVSATPPERLSELPRYLDAALSRIEKVQRDVIRDRDCTRRVAECAELLKNAMSRYPKDSVPEELKNVRWMIEELRVSLFAQQLGVKGQISDKRIAHEIDRVIKEIPPLR
ncbi:MAG: ATP-dependent RNA helicase HrpA [Succinivibrio sp.]|nr:ATP-dependent RNA helicase HrpA [Succinivibrio sp.]